METKQMLQNILDKNQKPSYVKVAIDGNRLIH